MSDIGISVTASDSATIDFITEGASQVIAGNRLGCVVEAPLP